MIFETRCAGCDTPGAAICTTCRFALLGPPPEHRRHGIIAAVPFTGRARRIVLALKYRNRRQAARHVARLLVNRLIELGVPPQVDVVTWAPTGRDRRHRRGFDQGEIIARTVARQLGLPCRRLLERSPASASQTGRSRAQRLDGPEFTARPDVAVRRVLVVDDVVTTGATLRAAQAALERAGAQSVFLCAVASTPATVAAQVVPIRRRAVASAA
jgi:predicted amidophosphoribosyltransferase